MSKELARKLDKARGNAMKKHGTQYVNMGGSHYHLDVVPTGSLMLDYKLGIGGFPYGHCVEVFGANKLGKSSAIGYPTLANVQQQGKLPALIAVEPRFTTPEDREWGERLGLNPDFLHIVYPDHVEQAFEMLRDLVFDNIVDYIMIDSLGGMGAESSAKEGGTKKAYGISGVVTDGLNAVMPRLYKNNIGLLVINQQRQAGKVGQTNIITYESPGGEGLKHHARIRIHLKPGSNRTKIKIDDEDVLVGQELTCLMKKNNMSQAQSKTAKFDFYHIETEEYGFGIDTAQDLINIGMITGVFQKSGTWYEHHTFPKGKLQGKPKVQAFIGEHPEVLPVIREEVMAIMLQKELAAAEKNREVKATEDGTTEQ